MWLTGVSHERWNKPQKSGCHGLRCLGQHGIASLSFVTPPPLLNSPVTLISLYFSPHCYVIYTVHWLFVWIMCVFAHSTDYYLTAVCDFSLQLYFLISSKIDESYYVKSLHSQVFKARKWFLEAKLYLIQGFTFLGGWQSHTLHSQSQLAFSTQMRLL